MVKFSALLEGKLLIISIAMSCIPDCIVEVQHNSNTDNTKEKKFKNKTRPEVLAHFKPPAQQTTAKNPQSITTNT